MGRKRVYCSFFCWFLAGIGKQLLKQKLLSTMRLPLSFGKENSLFFELFHLLAFGKSVGNARLEVPAAHFLGCMGGNNKTQGTDCCEFFKFNVLRQSTYFFSLSDSSYICFIPKILNCN